MYKNLLLLILIIGFSFSLQAKVKVDEPREGSKYIIGGERNIVLKMDKNYSQYKLELLKQDGTNLGIIKQGTWRTLSTPKTIYIKKYIPWKFGEINGKTVRRGVYRIKATVDSTYIPLASHISGKFSITVLRAHHLKGKDPAVTNQDSPPPLPIKKPDLIISNITFLKHTGFKATVTVQNIGPKASPPCTIELKIGCTGEGFKILEFEIPALKAKDPKKPDIGCAHIFHIELTYSGHLPFNEAKSIFTVDSQNNVFEENESNNTKIYDNCLK